MVKKANKKRTANKRDIIIRIATIIAIIVVLFIVYNFINSLQTLKMEDQEHEFFQYVMGRKIEYTGVLKMTQKDGITGLETDEGTIYLDSIPVYYKSEINKVILPNEMAIAFPMENGTLKKVNALSSIYIKYGEVYIEKGGLNKKISDAFLYDGSDLYFFIENTTVKVNGTTYKLPPLSYVNATYKGYVEIYNYDTDTYTYIENVKDDVIASTSNYTVNLSIDTMQYENTDQLLLKRIKNLQNLE